MTCELTCNARWSRVDKWKSACLLSRSSYCTSFDNPSCFNTIAPIDPSHFSPTLDIIYNLNPHLSLPFPLPPLTPSVSSSDSYLPSPTVSPWLPSQRQPAACLTPPVGAVLTGTDKGSQQGWEHVSQGYLGIPTARAGVGGCVTVRSSGPCWRTADPCFTSFYVSNSCR